MPQWRISPTLRSVLWLKGRWPPSSHCETGCSQGFLPIRTLGKYFLSAATWPKHDTGRATIVWCKVRKTTPLLSAMTLQQEIHFNMRTALALLYSTTEPQLRVAYHSTSLLHIYWLSVTRSRASGTEACWEDRSKPVWSWSKSHLYAWDLQMLCIFKKKK